MSSGLTTMAHNLTSASNDYFVMAEEYRSAVRFQNAKDAEVLYNKQRQQQIADQLTIKDAQEYGEDILIYMYEQQRKFLPSVAAIDTQTEIQWNMRSYLMDFIVEAHAALELSPESLYLATNIMDRYCSRRFVFRRHYQLLGSTALFIAAKFNDSSKKVPQLKELASMCCAQYDEDMFVQMERHIMITLDWEIASPTVDAFLNVALYGTDDHELEHMALYFSEIALFSRDFVSRLPSDIAMACLALARITLGGKVYSPEDGKYELSTLLALSQHIHHPSAVLILKYGTLQKSRVSTLLKDHLSHNAFVCVEDYLTQIKAMVTRECMPAESYASSANVSRTTSRTTDVSMELSHSHPCRPTVYYPPGTAHMPHGSLTPPITPDTEGWVGFTQDPPQIPAAKLPVTPVSSLGMPTPNVTVDYNNYDNWGEVRKW